MNNNRLLKLNLFVRVIKMTSIRELPATRQSARYILTAMTKQKNKKIWRQN